MSDNNLVIEPEGDQVSEETLDAGQVPQGGTLPKGSTDVDEKVKELTKKFERDIAGLKSSFQKNEYQLKQQMEKQRQDYEAHLREVKLSKMDETERKQFEEQELVERNRNYQAEAEKARQELLEREQRDQYRDFFASVGVPLDKLDSSGDLNTYVNSGFAEWASKTKALEKRLADFEKKKANPDEEEVTPPDVNTSKGKPPKGTSWSDLVKKYGSEERVYRLIETGQLPSSILPEA